MTEIALEQFSLPQMRPEKLKVGKTVEEIRSKFREKSQRLISKFRDTGPDASTDMQAMQTIIAREPEITKRTRSLLGLAEEQAESLTAAAVLPQSETNRSLGALANDTDDSSNGGADVVRHELSSLAHPDNSQLDIEQERRRREQIRLFARNFLQSFNRRNPSSLGLIDDALAQYDIFDDQTNLDSKDLPGISGYADMRKLVRFYESHITEDVPEQTVILGKDDIRGPFATKTLVYVTETTFNSAAFGRRMRNPDVDIAERYDTSKFFRPLKRPSHDKITFINNGNPPPDVYIHDISDTTGGIIDRRIRQRKKDSFTVSGCGSIIVGENVIPNIPNVTLSAQNVISVLPETRLSPAPTDKDNLITLSAGRVEFSRGSMVGVTEINAETLQIAEGAEIRNPYPSRQVEIKCQTIDDANDRPLNPQLFHVNDEDYVRRQTEFYGTVKTAELAQAERHGVGGIELLDRSEQVSQFVLTFLNALNQGMDRQRMIGEIYGRGAAGTRDSTIFASDIGTNIRAYNQGEQGKPEWERALIRGVDDMLRLVEYYNAHPQVEIPRKVFIVEKQKKLHPKDVGDVKTLVYWQEKWEQDVIKNSVTDVLGRHRYLSQNANQLIEIERSRDDELSFVSSRFGNSQKGKIPDLMIGSNIRGMHKSTLTINGFENIVVGGVTKASLRLKLACKELLTILPNASLLGDGNNSTIKADEVYLEGAMRAKTIRCNKFTNEGRGVSPPLGMADGEVSQIFCGEYNGERPHYPNVKVVTSQPGFEN